MIHETEHPYIVKNDEILSGEPIVKDTRVPVRAIVENWRMGIPPEAIPSHLPHLMVAQVFDALSYVSDHMDEILRHIKENHIPEELIGSTPRNRGHAAALRGRGLGGRPRRFGGTQRGQGIWSRSNSSDDQQWSVSPAAMAGVRRSHLREHLAPLLGRAPSQRPSGRLTDDLRRLRLHGLIARLPHTHRYRPTRDGRRAALCFTRTDARLFRSGLAQFIPAAVPPTSTLRAAFDHLHQASDDSCLANKLVA